MSERDDGATWREIAERALVGYSAAMVTVKNMVKAQELEPAGTKAVPGSRRPMTKYRPRSSGGWVTAPLAIDGVMRAWSRG